MLWLQEIRQMGFIAILAVTNISLDFLIDFHYFFTLRCRKFVIIIILLKSHAFSILFLYHY